MSKFAPSPERMQALRDIVPEGQRALFAALKAEIDEDQDEINENEAYLRRVLHWLVFISLGVGFMVAVTLVKIYFYGVMALWG